jgi:hypothetical protein
LDYKKNHQGNASWNISMVMHRQLTIIQEVWARSNVEKAYAFAERLAKVFQPHPSENEPKE